MFKPPVPIKSASPRPLTEEEQERVKAQKVARNLAVLTEKFGKKYEPKTKKAKKNFSGALPEVVPGSVDWKKQDSIPLNQCGAGGRHKKASGKKS